MTLTLCIIGWLLIGACSAIVVAKIDKDCLKINDLLLASLFGVIHVILMIWYVSKDKVIFDFGDKK